MGRLAGKVAVVVGGGSGIGAGAAERFQAEGASVCIADIAVSASSAGALLTMPHDVSSPADWARLRGSVLDTFGRVDVLVNSAGIFRDGMITTTDLELWNQILAVNQTGTFLGMQTFVDALSSDGGGSIVNLSSYAGAQGHGTSVAYSATKWAIRGMTRFAAREFAPRGVRVNAIVPGFIDTPMVRSATEELRASAVRRTPLGRLGTVGDVADLLVFLASDESAYITGTDMVIDGGILA